MRRAEKVHLLPFGDGGVLLDESAQKLFQLNTSATFVWSQLELDQDQATIALGLQQKFSITDAEAIDYLQDTQQLLASIGVLEGFENTGESTPTTTAANQEPINYDAADVVGWRDYQLLNSNIRVRFTRAEQIAMVDPVLGHLAAVDPPPHDTQLDIIVDHNGRIHLCQDQRSRLSCDNNEQLAPLVKSLVWQTGINQHDYFLNIHAGVVSDGKRCYLFPAASGSGKSTLTAALVQRGMQYYSDEAALLHEPDFCVEAVPLALCVKASGTDVLGKYYPELHQLPLHQRSDGKTVRYLPPPGTAAPPKNSRRPVAAIIFPSYDPTLATTLEAIEGTQALQLLLRQCLIVDTRLDKAKVARLLAWVEATPSYTLAVGDLETALGLIEQLNQQPGYLESE